MILELAFLLMEPLIGRALRTARSQEVGQYMKRQALCARDHGRNGVIEDSPDDEALNPSERVYDREDPDMG